MIYLFKLHYPAYSVHSSWQMDTFNKKTSFLCGSHHRIICSDTIWSKIKVPLEGEPCLVGSLQLGNHWHHRVGMVVAHFPTQGRNGSSTTPFLDSRSIAKRALVLVSCNRIIHQWKHFTCSGTDFLGSRCLKKWTGEKSNDACLMSGLYTLKSYIDKCTRIYFYTINYIIYFFLTATSSVNAAKATIMQCTCIYAHMQPSLTLIYFAHLYHRLYVHARFFPSFIILLVLYS